MPHAQRALTRADVARYAADHCFCPTDDHRVGLELEFLTFPAAGRHGRPELARMQQAVEGRLPAGGRVTFEPGGQLEVSTAPHANAAAAIAAAQLDVAAVSECMASIGVELVAVGYDRWRAPQRLVESDRYRAMERWFDADGPAGRQMMCNTAALQVNIDFGPAATHRRRWDTAHAVGPVLVAAFANSPDAQWRSSRLAAWFDTDNGRSAPVDGLDTDPAAAWAQYALAANALLSADEPLRTPLPFGEWIDHGCDVGFPDDRDLAYHLTTLFPPVRPRGWLEVRYLDALPSPWWEAATSTLVTLLREDVMDEARRVSRPVAGRWRDAARYGLDDDALAEAADACFALAVDAGGDAGVDEYRTRYVARREPAWA